jgi:hypothetical protein
MDAKCACQKCGGHILFDASGLKPDEARAISCPHCQQETLIYVPRMPLEQAPPPPPMPVRSSPPPPPATAGLKINKPAKPSAPDQNSLYFFQSIGGEAGPYTLGQLSSLMGSGQITGDVLCRAAEAQEWRPISALIENHPKPPQMIRPAASARSGPDYANYIMIVVLVLSVVAFFLPNISLSIPMLGKVNVSMFDFVKPSASDAKNTNETTAKRKFSFKDLSSEQMAGLKKMGVGVLMCVVAVFGLLGHYLLSVVWAILNFGFRKTFGFLNFLWLGLAVQFPLLFTAGFYLTMSALKSQILAEAAKNNSGAAPNPEAVAMVTGIMNSISVGPAAMMWVLFGVALAAFILPPMLRRNA